MGTRCSPTSLKIAIAEEMAIYPYASQEAQALVRPPGETGRR
jgi:hypothetical protein